MASISVSASRCALVIHMLANSYGLPDARSTSPKRVAADTSIVLSTARLKVRGAAGFRCGASRLRCGRGGYTTGRCRPGLAARYPRRGTSYKRGGGGGNGCVAGR